MNKRQREKKAKLFIYGFKRLLERAQYAMDQPETKAMLQEMITARVRVASGQCIVASTPSVYNEEFSLGFTLDDHGVTCDDKNS